MALAGRELRHFVAYTLAGTSLIASLLTLFARIYFWQGVTYAPVHIWLALDFIIVAGPLALWLAARKQRAAIALSLAQLILLAIASI